MRRSRILVLAALLPLAACGGGGSGEPAVPDAGTSGAAAVDPDTRDDTVSGAGAPEAGTPAGNMPFGTAPPPDLPPTGQPDMDAVDLPVFDDDAGMAPDGAPLPPAPGEGASPDPSPGDDATFRRLESRVATDLVDARNHESWICTGETRRIEYRFTIASDGMRSGAELDGRGGLTPAGFGWAAIGADTLLLDYRDVGRQVELGSILFAGDDALRANDGASGPLECRRQRYVAGAPTRDVSVAAPEDVDPDVEAAAALAGRIETARANDDTFDYWHCEITDGRAVGYVFAGEGVLDPDRRAVAFDVERHDAIVPDGDPDVGDDGDPEPPRPVIDPEADGGRPFRWLATDGTTLVLVPLDADVALGAGNVETTALDGIVFPVDDAFTARRTDGALLQCLRDGNG